MNNADKPINAELNSPELIAQWVIDNRYPTSENEKQMIVKCPLF